MIEWRPVVGWEEYYAVSSEGHVQNLRTGHLLARTYSKYLFVALTANGVRASRMVHILVAEAFLGPAPSPEHIVSHEDDDPTNCRASNLKWRTRLENTEMARARGLHRQGTRHYLSTLTEMDIVEIKESALSNRQLAEQYGVNASTISRIRSAQTHRRGAGGIKL